MESAKIQKRNEKNPNAKNKILIHPQQT